MRFMVLRKTDESSEGALPDEVRLGANGARVSFCGGTATVVDGPPAAKNRAAGITMIDVESREAAIEWVKRSAALGDDVEIEIREGGCPGGVPSVIHPDHPASGQTR